MRRLADSALLWFLVFVAVLGVVTALLARLPADCGCWTRQAQVVLLPLGGLVSLVGTVVAARSRPASADRDARLGTVLIGAGVVLVVLAQVLGLFDRG